MPSALVLRRNDGTVTPAVEEVSSAELPEEDTEVGVLYSSLNYKDALAVTGRGKIVRGSYPFVPGIDLAGRVLSCSSDAYQPGDLVVGTGWGLGESHWGGYAEMQRVDHATLVHLPEDLSPEAAMVAGTAGLTAMLSVMALEAYGVESSNGEVLVTGASGGVGSLAVAFLSREGFRVAASTGSGDARSYLEELGASRVIERTELSGGAARPLDSAVWAGAIDVVGGKTLEAVVSKLDRHGAVAVCGLAGGHELHTTVFPLILRGVALLGIDSNTCPNDVRGEAWDRIADALTNDLVDLVKSKVIGLDDVPEYSERVLSGAVRGRVVVRTS